MMSKKKKVRNYRGSKTHGGGSMKKRRGAGSRGGRGRAGSGKRGDSKKPSYWKDPRFGTTERGFYNHQKKAVQSINVADLDRRVTALEKAGQITAQDGVYALDLSALGIHKLLGTGKITHKVHVTVDSVSEKATQKIEAAGGSVTTPDAKKE